MQHRLLLSNVKPQWVVILQCLKCASIIIIPQLDRERQQLPAQPVNAGHCAKDLHRICVRDYERLDSLEKSGSRIFRPTRDTQMGTKRSFCNHRILQWYSPPVIWKTHQFQRIKKKLSQQTTEICSFVWNNAALTSPLSARSHMKGLEVNSCTTKEGETHKQWWLDLHDNRIYKRESKRYRLEMNMHLQIGLPASLLCRPETCWWCGCGLGPGSLAFWGLTGRKARTKRRLERACEKWRFST